MPPSVPLSADDQAHIDQVIAQLTPLTDEQLDDIADVLARIRLQRSSVAEDESS